MKSKIDRILMCCTEKVLGKNEAEKILNELIGKIPDLDKSIISDTMYALRNVAEEDIRYISAVLFNGDIHIALVINIPELPITEDLSKDRVYAYVINVTVPEFSEFGTITFEWDAVNETYRRNS